MIKVKNTLVPLLLVFMLFSGRALALTWHTEYVEAPKFFLTMRHYLALDSQGHPHLAYGGDYLYYAYYDGTNWHTETVDDSPGAGWYASLALDSHDLPHIAYYDSTNENLKYAYFDGTTWHIETVDSQRSVGYYASLALDSHDLPHIAYLDWTHADLKYAYFDGTNWHTETVDSQGYVGEYASLTLDSHDLPHIAYYLSLIHI